MKNRALRYCAIALALYFILGAAFFFLAGRSLHATDAKTEAVSSKGSLGELHLGQSVEQTFVCAYDTLNELGIRATTTASCRDILRVTILDGNRTELISQDVNAAEIPSGEVYLLKLQTPLSDTKGKELTLRLQSLQGASGNAIALHFGNTKDSGRFSTNVKVEHPLLLNGQPVTDTEGNTCSLVLAVHGTNLHAFGQYYWWIYLGIGILFAAYLGYVLYCHKKNKSCLTLTVIRSIYKYNFLIRQLVARDFKTKYKRSVLGMLWSFLNPLLTMTIQYIVFSTIFKSDIHNFATYLLCGIVCFNFFNEASGMCLMSIVGNASLINKVYVPKYIYPFSRTLSSSINLLMSMVPLLLMMIITRAPFTPAILLLPFALVMLFLVTYGVGLILATMMVFFRDTQFLWGIFSMLLMYMTPVFYPESIIPTKILPLFKLNPLYHVIRFMRSILIDGVSPEPKAYLFCIILCLIPLILGIAVFRKNQDKFILNI